MNKNTSILLMPTSFFYFILGFILILAPSKTLNNLSITLTAILSILGFLGLFSFFHNKEFKQKNYINLISGVTSAWLALITLNYYDLFLNIIPIAISVYSVNLTISFIIEYYLTKENYKIIISLILIIINILLTFKVFVVITTKISGLFLILLSFFLLTKSMINLTNQENKKTTSRLKKKSKK